MREIMYLTGYEYQKIFRKHSTWIALILVFVWAVISGFGGIIGDYYVDGENSQSLPEDQNTAGSSGAPGNQRAERRVFPQRERNIKIPAAAPGGAALQ